MKLKPDESPRINEEVQSGLQSQQQLKKDIAGDKHRQAGRSTHKFALGFLGAIGLIVLMVILSMLFSSVDSGKDWSDVMDEVDTFYEVRQAEDTPDRKVWIGKMKEGSLSPTILTATRLPNGMWKTQLEHIDIRMK